MDDSCVVCGCLLERDMVSRFCPNVDCVMYGKYVDAAS